MKLLSLAIVAILISACAGPMVYFKSGNNAHREQQDFAECEFEAVKATGSAPSGSITSDMSGTIANDISTGVRRGEIKHACLVARGYSLKQQE
ncbi:hypothetical protein [Nitrosospira sp. Is2]|uniref:hypothetical protein n=1 Tax=Nitrosospira sp. Is2 TaxID=3080532 RepID=UPI002953EEC2|nr:hypothetical protein [Nitrosospira sp. Is2]WON74158.1 hypothetical protein R5L00_01320 [Nitrosospira sp. Is2]